MKTKFWKYRRKLNIVLLFVFLSISLAGCCGSGTAETDTGRTIRFGVANRTFKETCYLFMQQGSEAEAQKRNMEVSWQACDLNISTLMSIVENYIAQDYDCIAIEPCDTSTIYQTAKEVQQAGIPLIDIDQKMDGIIPDLYMTANNYEFGCMQVEDFISRWGTEKDARCVILGGPDGEYGADQIMSGVEDTIAKYSNLHVVFRQTIEAWDREKAMKSMEDAISVNGDGIDVVFAANDGMELGAYKASENAGLKDKIFFYGGDDDKETIEMILGGAHNIYTIDRNSYLNGEMLTEAAYQLASGQDVTYDEIDSDGYKVRWVKLDMVSYDHIDSAKAKYPDLFTGQ